MFPSAESESLNFYIFTTTDSVRRIYSLDPVVYLFRYQKFHTVSRKGCRGTFTKEHSNFQRVILTPKTELTF